MKRLSRGCFSLTGCPPASRSTIPDLFEGGSTEALSFLKKTVEPAHTEYRDDRFVAAFARDGHDKATSPSPISSAR